MRRYAAKGISLAVHAVFVTALLALMQGSTLELKPAAPAPIKPTVVYLVDRTPARGGGGGGGNPAPAPPVQMEIPAPHPVAVVPELIAAPADVIPSLAVPVMTSANAMLTATGGVSGAISVPLGGGGKGGGIGAGTGDGVGPGNATGFGGAGVPGVGGVSDPVRIHEEKPPYTPEARREKIEGEVVVEAVIDETGHVANARVTKSLDRAFGLDEQARLAAMKSLFRPCKRNGKPVACLVSFAMTFSIR